MQQLLGFSLNSLLHAHSGSRMLLEETEDSRRTGVLLHSTD